MTAIAPTTSTGPTYVQSGLPTRKPTEEELDILRMVDKTISLHYNRRNELEMWKSLTNNGQNKIYSVLGAGTYGVVISTQKPDGKYLAVKISKGNVFNESIIKEGKNLERLHKLDPDFFVPYRESKEARFHTNLRCTTCCNLRPILVTDFGGDNVEKKYVSKNPHFNLQEFMQIVHQFLTLYTTMYYKKIELGDIKPDNMVSGRNHKIKIIDTADAHNFGDNKQDWYETSRPYRSPSVLCKQVDGGQTGFSLACSLAAILTGHTLFHYETFEKSTPELRMFTQLCQVFSFLHQPSSTFMKKITPKWKSAVFGKTQHDQEEAMKILQGAYAKEPHKTPEHILRKRIQAAISSDNPRVGIGNIDPQEFTDHFIDFLKQFMEYETIPIPENLQKHPFLKYLQPS